MRTEIRKNSVVAKIPRVKQTHLVLYSKRFYVIRIWDIGSDGLETFRVTFIQLQTCSSSVKSVKSFIKSKITRKFAMIDQIYIYRQSIPLKSKLLRIIVHNHWNIDAHR